MNFHKNYYKLCLPSLMVSLAVFILGVAFALIFGFNTTTVTPYGIGGLVFYLSIYLLAVSVFDVIYLRIRFNWSTGFVVVLKNYIDIFLLVAILAIVRVPLTLYTVFACVLTTMFGNFVSLFLLKKANELKNVEKNFETLNNSVIESSIKHLLIIAFALLVALSMFLGTALSNILSFSLAGAIGVVVSFLTAIFMLVPIWLGFVKREEKLKNKQKEVIVKQNTNTQTEQTSDNATTQN